MSLYSRLFLLSVAAIVGLVVLFILGRLGRATSLDGLAVRLHGTATAETITMQVTLRGGTRVPEVTLRSSTCPRVTVVAHVSDMRMMYDESTAPTAITLEALHQWTNKCGVGADGNVLAEAALQILTAMHDGALLDVWKGSESVSAARVERITFR